VGGQQRDEAVPQLPGCPVGGVETGGGDDAAEGAPDVGGIQGGAVGGGEDQAVVLPSFAGVGSLPLLLLAVVLQGGHAAAGQGEGAARLPGLGVSPGPDRAPQFDGGRYGRLSVGLAGQVDM